MNILSKQFLIQTTSPLVEAYEAYYINNGTMTLLGDVTDLSKTFAAQDEFIYSNLFVYEDYLYMNAVKQSQSDVKGLTGRAINSSYKLLIMRSSSILVGEYDNGRIVYSVFPSIGTPKKVCGYISSSDQAFIETSNGLYSSVSGGTQISTLKNWTKITGYGNKNSANYYGYGINDGKLYYLYANGNGVVQQGSDTTWTDITGSYENGSWHGYGINNGKLYRLSGTPTQIGSDTTWTKVSGTSSSGGTARALGLNNGKLYTIYSTTATQVGSSTDWKNCSGYCGSTARAIAYDSSALYSIQTNGTTTKLMDGDFVYCGQNYDTSGYAVVIRRVYR